MKNSTDGPTSLTVAGISLLVLGLIAFEPAMEVHHPILYTICLGMLSIGAILVWHQRYAAKARTRPHGAPS